MISKPINLAKRFYKLKCVQSLTFHVTYGSKRNYDLEYKYVLPCIYVIWFELGLDGGLGWPEEMQEVLGEYCTSIDEEGSDIYNRIIRKLYIYLYLYLHIFKML